VNYKVSNWDLIKFNSSLSNCLLADVMVWNIPHHLIAIYTCVMNCQSKPMGQNVLNGRIQISSWLCYVRKGTNTVCHIACMAN